ALIEEPSQRDADLRVPALLVDFRPALDRAGHCRDRWPVLAAHRAEVELLRAHLIGEGRHLRPRLERLGEHLLGGRVLTRCRPVRRRTSPARSGRAAGWPRPPVPRWTERKPAAIASAGWSVRSRRAAGRR